MGIHKLVKNERIFGGVLAVGLMAGLGIAVTPTLLNANAEPAAVVETTEPALTFDLTGTTENGLASEQESEAAAAEQARLAAEAEAERVAQEQAAAAEAERIAAEQSAAEQESYDEPVYVEPEPEPEYTGPDPNTQSHTICEVLADGTEVPCEN